MRRNARRSEAFEHVLGEATVLELCGRGIDCYMTEIDASIQPVPDVLDHGCQHLTSDPRCQTGILERGLESNWGFYVSVRIAPAQQSLKACQSAGAEPNLRLIMRRDAPFGDGPARIAEHPRAMLYVRPHGGCVHNSAAPSLSLRHIKRNTCLPQEV